MQYGSLTGYNTPWSAGRGSDLFPNHSLIKTGFSKASKCCKIISKFNGIYLGRKPSSFLLTFVNFHAFFRTFEFKFQVQITGFISRIPKMKNVLGFIFAN